MNLITVDTLIKSCRLKWRPWSKRVRNNFLLKISFLGGLLLKLKIIVFSLVLYFCKDKIYYFKIKEKWSNNMGLFLRFKELKKSTFLAGKLSLWIFHWKYIVFTNVQIIWRNNKLFVIFYWKNLLEQYHQDVSTHLHDLNT